MTGPAGRAQRKEATRRRLLEVALSLAAHRSLADIGLQEVARAAGLVPTGFYRYFESMDALGVELVDESMRPLREMIRSARRGIADHGDMITGTVAVLGREVEQHPDLFRFLSRERHGDVRGVRRAIRAELALLTGELAVDLARLTGSDWSAEDLTMAAELMVAAMLAAVVHLLEADARHPAERRAVLDRAERQLRLVVLGMGGWRSKE